MTLNKIVLRKREHKSPQLPVGQGWPGSGRYKYFHLLLISASIPETKIPLAHHYQRRFIMLVAHGGKPKEETRRGVRVTMEFEIEDSAELYMHPHR